MMTTSAIMAGSVCSAWPVCSAYARNRKTPSDQLELATLSRLPARSSRREAAEFACTTCSLTEVSANTITVAYAEAMLVATPATMLVDGKNRQSSPD